MKHPERRGTSTEFDDKTGKIIKETKNVFMGYWYDVGICFQCKKGKPSQSKRSCFIKHPELVSINLCYIKQAVNAGINPFKKDKK